MAEKVKNMQRQVMHTGYDEAVACAAIKEAASKIAECAHNIGYTEDSKKIRRYLARIRSLVKDEILFACRVIRQHN